MRTPSISSLAASPRRPCSATATTPSTTPRRARWLKFLASKIGGNPLTADEEKANPTAADAYYERCGNWLRENTRDHKRFNLIFEELVTYGYRRNLYGLKWLGLLLNAIVVIVCAVWIWKRWPIPGDDGVSTRLIYVLIVALAHAAFFVYVVTKASVIEAGQQYARQLLLGCETLATGAPLKKAQKATKKRK